MSAYRQPAYALLDRAAAQVPARVACRYYDQSWTYEGLQHDVYRATGLLAELGIGPGDRVGLLLPNVPEYIIGLNALWRRGAIGVAISPLMVPEEVEGLLRSLDCRHVIALDLLAHLLPSGNGTLAKTLLVSLRERLPGYQQVGYFLARYKRTGLWYVPTGDRAVWFWDALDECAPQRDTADLDPDATPAYILPTGGTTGQPKSVTLSHRNLTANALQQATLAGGTMGQEKLMAVLPFFHSYGLSAVILGGAALGAELILHHRFSTHQVLQLIAEHRPTVLHAVPAMLAAMNAQLRSKPSSIDSLKWVISGGAPLPEETAAEFAEHCGGIVVEGYGLSEASPVTHSGPLDGTARYGTIGLPLPDTQCRIVDAETGTVDVLPGEVGELIVRGPQVMLGYWNNASATAETIRDGWLYTGDLAKQDALGFYQIVDRKKDLVITSGYNVYPRDVETVLRRCPLIEDVAVVGVPDEQRGELVKAFVRMRSGQTFDTKALDAFCREHLAAHRRPRQYEQVVGELPKNFLGKVLRRKLRERAIGFAEPTVMDSDEHGWNDGLAAGRHTGEDDPAESLAARTEPNREEAAQ
ncbi:AMP-binding protein [Roseimaritima sediminicola]|uniref:AMP-binding protein n=1 Tax=Roseimaritima sediminicola TaxID=2662066 RepID=UPI0012985752|nr:AMP-binding protein [Roseimaritima sediminicola]